MSSEEAVAVLDAVAKRDEQPVAHHVEAFHRAVTAQVGDLDDVLWNCWNNFFDTVERTPPGEQDRLVEFLAVLKGFEEKDEKGERKVYEAKSGKLWEELPSFAWMARDRWNFDVREPRMTPEDLTRCNNKAAFLARITTISTSKEDPLDFSLFALWALREAFEEECPKNYNSEPAIRNAAVWIEYAGKTLWQLAVDNREFRDRLAIPGKKFADKPWRGFNEERWNVWRAGFEEVGSQAEASDVEEAKSLEKQGAGQTS